MKTSTQLNALIRNASKENGVAPQILLRKYFMDKFLERLSLSKYNKNFILKGGILISALVGDAQRATMDIDATLKGQALSKENLEIILNEIIAIDNNDNIVYQIDNIESIMDDSDYSGLRAHIKVNFDKIRQNIKLDISTGDIITPGEVKFEYITLLEKNKIHVLTYNIETVLAEKLETILTRNITNTRMRDYYDCKLLSDLFRDVINYKTLKQAFYKTVEVRATQELVKDYKDILIDIRADFGQKGSWKIYVAKNPYASEIEFDQVVDSVEKLMKIIMEN